MSPWHPGRGYHRLVPSETARTDVLSWEELTMSVAGYVGATWLGLGLAAVAAVSGARAQGGLSAYQGAWLQRGPECAEIYSSAGKGASFKKPVDIFAPAFIVSGSRLR